jgi:murein DD-endopeptidase MepM/ murein hydrolase activator NlpD
MAKTPASSPLVHTDDEVIENNKEDQGIPKKWQQIWGKLLRLGLGETTLHIITGVFAVVLILVIVWVMNSYFLKQKEDGSGLGALTAATPTSIFPSVTGVDTTSLESSFGISRLAQIHTNFPSHPRDKITTYTIQTGDTIIGIAEKFGLTPETILLCNRYILVGLPENLEPGTVINIPPMDGVIYIWVTGNGLNGVASFYGVTPDVIIDWPENNLNRATLGDLSLPNIPAGTSLFIPGGIAETVDWLPQVSRDTPAVSTSGGAGYCGEVTGVSGTGTFIWPTTDTWLSGYDYTSIHHGIDIDGDIGFPIYASDAGVVVYAGSNSNGYGNLNILDHDNGWQTVYGHLNAIYVSCGESVAQGYVIGELGTTGNSTGPHLHFEIRKDGEYMNPWNLLIY